MQLITHRINSVASLKDHDESFGAEIDIRYHENNLILTHDPFNHHFQPLDSLESFLKEWKSNGPLILNIKTEGVEHACIDLINKYKIPNWFFLDLSMPFFVKFAAAARDKKIPGLSPENLAVRFSDKEPIEYALSFSGQAGWVWVDWFDTIPLNKETHHKLKEANFKLCLVSPELQGKDLSLIESYKKHLSNESIGADAVCTKRPDLWM